MDVAGERPQWLGDRDEVDVVGPDSLKYLQSQMTQDLRAMVDGERVWSLLLEPAGKVVALVGITRLGAEQWTVDVDPGWLDTVVGRLRRFMIRVRADLVERPCAQPRPADVGGRVEAGWPAMGAEIVVGQSIPAELGVLDVAVSFTKGCYPGQELVERMDARQASARRHLVTIDCPAGTMAGDVIDGDDGPVTVTTVSGVRALGYAGRVPPRPSSAST